MHYNSESLILTVLNIYRSRHLSMYVDNIFFNFCTFRMVALFFVYFKLVKFSFFIIYWAVVSLLFDFDKIYHYYYLPKGTLKLKSTEDLVSEKSIQTQRAKSKRGAYYHVIQFETFYNFTINYRQEVDVSPPGCIQSLMSKIIL